MNEYNFGAPDIFSASKLKKEVNKKKRELIRSLPTIIVWVLLFVVAIATFAEFSFAKVGTIDFAASSILFAVCTYMTIFLRKHTGAMRGRMDDVYLAAKKTHEEKCRLVSDTLTGEDSLANFCIEWVSDEVERAQRTILSGTGVTDEQWAEFSPLGHSVRMVVYSPQKLKRLLKRGKINDGEHRRLIALKGLPSVQKMAICRACLIEKQRLNPVDLVYESSTREARERTPIRLKSVEHRQDFSQIVSVTLTMFGIMAVVPEVAALDFSIKTIIYCLTRVASLLMTGFNADMRGEALYTVDTVENYQIQDSLLDEALKWRENRENKRKNSHEDLSFDRRRAAQDGTACELLGGSEEGIHTSCT